MSSAGWCAIANSESNVFKQLRKINDLTSRNASLVLDVRNSTIEDVSR
jgi:hypothetical protein